MEENDVFVMMRNHILILLRLDHHCAAIDMGIDCIRLDGDLDIT